jgi:hypothetical protein
VPVVLRSASKKFFAIDDMAVQARGYANELGELVQTTDRELGEAGDDEEEARSQRQ